MTNGIYFYNTIREEWSASTSPNETPRPSFSDAVDPTIFIKEAAASSSSSGVIGGGSCISQTGSSSLKIYSFKELKAATRKSIRGGIRFNNVRGGSSISQTQIPPSDGGKWGSSNLKNFSFKELEAATRKFKLEGVLGEGGFGRVYKGWIDENTLTGTKPGRGIAVAVKRLSKHSSQGREEWLAEVNYLGQLYHPNVVSLLGYCFDNQEYLLAYEYMPQGSLCNHLSRSLLSWRLRMKVAFGAAKGLAFLHTAQINVIHRGVQSSNILLDSDYNPKLSDFGLARDGPIGDTTHVSTMVKGSGGFIAPEYLATGHLNCKSDVYSFGAVLLEILTGRRIYDCHFLFEELNLEEWARSYLMHKEKFSCILDSHLKGQCALEDALKVATLAYHCLSNDPKCRPNMNEVAIALEELQNSEEK